VNVMLRPWLRPTPRLSGRIQRRYFKPRSKRQLIELNESCTDAAGVVVITSCELLIPTVCATVIVIYCNIYSNIGPDDD